MPRLPCLWTGAALCLTKVNAGKKAVEKSLSNAIMSAIWNARNDVVLERKTNPKLRTLLGLQKVTLINGIMLKILPLAHHVLIIKFMMVRAFSPPIDNRIKVNVERLCLIATFFWFDRWWLEIVKVG
uniref:Uncharacterized protein n=1 Tax=Cannabis sativa TaxID=3483 RepID=A0A803NSN8_CANSA